jgi:geranylgeranyl diphosphate synthase type II
MIHTYSLIHDDLPSMDNDDFRRGRPTNHKVYGEAMAILAGDALLTDAFMVASTAQLANPADMAFAIGTLAECAGSMGMVGGQVLDIGSEERELTEQEVIDIQTRKTGALISAACVLGTIAGGGSEEQIDAAAQFAAGLGMAFQIRDDMLDVIGTQEEMGKGVGTDAMKNTFVRLHGLEKCEELVQTYTQYAIDALSVFEDTDFIIALAKSLTDRRV